jgi:ABC-2 type transport system permease protein
MGTTAPTPPDNDTTRTGAGRGRPGGDTGTGSAPNVIHDIGYRHYDGPRLGRSYARRSLFSQSLRGAYGLGRSAKSKVLPMLLYVTMCLPALIMVAVVLYAQANHVPMSKLPVQYTRYAIIMQAVIGLFVAAQAPQSVSFDLRYKTTPLYFSRPIERVDYVVAKFGALATALFILTATPLVILYAGALLAKFDSSDQTTGFARAMLSVLMLSLLFAGIGLVIAALTPRRGFGVAAIIAFFTFSYGAVSTLQAVAATQGDNAGLGAWLGLFSPITLIDGVQTWWLGAASSNVGGEGPPSALAGAVFLLVLLGAVAGSFRLLMRRYGKAVLS